MELEYYVYVHKDKEGNVLYIGKGKNERCVSTQKRDEEHAEWMKEYLRVGDFSFVEYAYDILTEEEALEHEKRMIKDLEPKFNKYYLVEDSLVRADNMREVQKISAEKRKRKVVTPDGTFDSVAEARDHHQMSHGGFIKRLKNPKFPEYYYDE